MKLPHAMRMGVAIVAALCISGCGAANYYADLEEGYKAKGFFRTETAPADALFDNADLRRNFIEVALYSEFGKGVEANRTPGALGRWERPVRYGILGAAQTGRDLLDTLALMGRIENRTGLDIKRVIDRPEDDEPNFIIFIVDDEERELILDKLNGRLGEEATAFQKRWAEDIRRPCIGTIYYGEDGSIVGAAVFIKAEIIGLFRKSCLHEEIVQSFGLINDADFIRPSLFNDTNEFALLTLHDEYLLSILYDERLSPGMTETDVAPLLDEIIEDIRPEGSM